MTWASQTHVRFRLQRACRLPTPHPHPPPAPRWNRANDQTVVTSQDGGRAVWGVMPTVEDRRAVGLVSLRSAPSRHYRAARAVSHARAAAHAHAPAAAHTACTAALSTFTLRYACGDAAVPCLHHTPTRALPLPYAAPRTAYTGYRAYHLRLAPALPLRARPTHIPTPALHCATRNAAAAPLHRGCLACLPRLHATPFYLRAARSRPYLPSSPHRPRWRAGTWTRGCADMIGRTCNASLLWTDVVQRGLAIRLSRACLRTITIRH